MKTLIHIGQHKTASTSIQNTLVNNHSRLINAGLWYPTELAGIEFPSHYPLNIYCLDENRLSHKKAKLMNSNPKHIKSIKNLLLDDIAFQYKQAQNSGCHTVLWSNEGLYLLNSIDEYQRLYDLFSPFSEQIKVVCCFREVNAFKKSYTNQLYKSGFQTSKDNDSFCYVEPDSWLFDYIRKQQILSQVFNNQTEFFDYTNTGMVELFLTKAGFPNLKLEELQLNKSHF